jgi:hypothetical protein
MKECYLISPITDCLWSIDEWERYRQVVTKDWDEKDERVQKMHLSVLVTYAPEVVEGE